MSDEKSALVEALNACVARERTLRDAMGAYHAYFARWRIHRLERWFCKGAELACSRIQAIELSVYRLGGSPSLDRESFDLVDLFDGEDSADAGKIGPLFEGLKNLAKETRDLYDEAGKAAGDAGDATSRNVCSDGQRQVEDVVQRLQAKLNKVALIGAESYIAHHMHEMG